MALPTSDIEWVNALAMCHDGERPQLEAYDAEYKLESSRSFLHPDVAAEMDERIDQLVIAWPQLVVDSLEERLDVEGFRLRDAEDDDDDLWRVWQYNGLDEESQLAHLDALIMRRCYICVGANEDDADTPLVTFESPLQMYADVDPRTRKVRGALRRWIDFEDSLVRLPERYATLYLPDRTVFYEYGASAWKETHRDIHNLGLPPVVPMVNRARLGDRRGISELDKVLPLTRGANKVGTDMLVASEMVSVPLRGFFGVAPDEFEDQDGNKLSPMQAIMARMLAIPGDSSTMKQFEFAAAQLSNFTQVIDKLSELTGSIAALPAHYMGKATDNPPSADAIRSNEARLVKRAERKQRAFGGAHEDGARLIRRFQTGDWDPALRRLETRWRNASTPTIAQMADAAVKLKTSEIISIRQAQEDCGYTDGQIQRMKLDIAEETASMAAVFKLPTAAEQANADVTPPLPAVPGAAA